MDESNGKNGFRLYDDPAPIPLRRAAGGRQPDETTSRLVAHVGTVIGELPVGRGNARQISHGTQREMLKFQNRLQSARISGRLPANLATTIREMVDREKGSGLGIYGLWVFMKAPQPVEELV